MKTDRLRKERGRDTRGDVGRRTMRGREVRERRASRTRTRVAKRDSDLPGKIETDTGRERGRAGMETGG